MEEGGRVEKELPEVLGKPLALSPSPAWQAPTASWQPLRLGYWENSPNWGGELGARWPETKWELPQKVLNLLLQWPTFL